MTRLTALTAFIAIVIAANLMTATLGLVTWLGLTATAGTWLAGFAFVARDTLHETAGRTWVIAGIALGAVISAAFSPRLALASGVAFLASELADLAVYTPLRQRHPTAAAIASNTVGAIVDTAIFLGISGFPWSTMPAQLAIKIGTTTLFVLGIRGARALLRQPVQ